MPQHDSLIKQTDNYDSSLEQSLTDSYAASNDSLAAYREKYWHKKHIFHYEYSPFSPIQPNIGKLYIYKIPFIRYFEAQQLIINKKQELDSIPQLKEIPIRDSIADKEAGSSIKDTIDDTTIKIRFQTPIIYAQKEAFFDFQTIGMPKAFQQLDSFNTANNRKISVVFGKKVVPEDKPYFYNNEYVKIESNNELKVNWAERDWLFWPLLALVIYIILTRYKYRTFISQTVTSVFYSRMSVRLLKEKNESTSPVIQSLLFFYFLATGLFVYMSMNFYGLYLFYTHGFYSFLVFSLLITLIYFIKIASIKILGFIFLQKRLVDEYIHNVKLFNITFSIILLPIVICIPFLNAYIIDESHLIQTGFVLYIIIFILKLIRGFFVSYRQNVSVFYILLYLCTLEILPIALLIRIATL